MKKNQISVEDIKNYHNLSGLPIKKFLGTFGKVYKELGLKDKIDELSDQEVYQLLSDNPMLVKRPLVVDGDTVLNGFKLETYENIWK